MTLIWLGGLLGALGALFVYELVTFEVGTYEVTWQEEETSVTGQADLAEGSEATFQFPAAGIRGTAIHFDLVWQDPDGEPDTFLLEVAGPTAAYEHRVEDASGEVTVRFDLGERLPSQRVEGLGEANAIRRASQPADWEGHDGNWTVTVRLVAAPGQQLPVLGVEPVTDGANDFRLEARYVAQEPTARRV